MSVRIPLRVFPSYTQVVNLEGKQYKLKVDYNQSHDFYTIGFYTVDDVPIVTGIKVVRDYNVLRPYASVELPQGMLFFTDLSGTVDRIGYEDVESLVAGLYLTQEELSA